MPVERPMTFVEQGMEHALINQIGSLELKVIKGSVAQVDLERQNVQLVDQLNNMHNELDTAKRQVVALQLEGNWNYDVAAAPSVTLLLGHAVKRSKTMLVHKLMTTRGREVWTNAATGKEVEINAWMRIPPINLAEPPVTKLEGW